MGAILTPADLKPVSEARAALELMRDAFNARAGNRIDAGRYDAGAAFETLAARLQKAIDAFDYEIDASTPDATPAQCARSMVMSESA